MMIYDDFKVKKDKIVLLVYRKYIRALTLTARGLTFDVRI